jgi:polyisoprenoid-binding protein YceI
MQLLCRQVPGENITMSATETSVATGTWTIDAVHSSVGFEVKHLGVSTFRGSFKDVAGTITTDHGTVTAVEGTIDTASVQTVDAALNGHLQAPDFFDSASYPQGKFRSTEIEDLGEGRLRIVGELELRGVTKPVEIDASISGVLGNDPYGNDRLGLSGSAVIDRTEFGISWNAPLANGVLTVAEKVRLVLDVSATRPAS